MSVLKSALDKRDTLVAQRIRVSLLEGGAALRDDDDGRKSVPSAGNRSGRVKACRERADVALDTHGRISAESWPCLSCSLRTRLRPFETILASCAFAWLKITCIPHNNRLQQPEPNQEHRSPSSSSRTTDGGSTTSRALWNALHSRTVTTRFEAAVAARLYSLVLSSRSEERDRSSFRL